MISEQSLNPVKFEDSLISRNTNHLKKNPPKTVSTKESFQHSNKNTYNDLKKAYLSSLTDMSMTPAERSPKARPFSFASHDSALKRLKLKLNRLGGKSINSPTTSLKPAARLIVNGILLFRFASTFLRT